MRSKLGFALAFILSMLAAVSLLQPVWVSAASQDQPTIAKDSVQITAWTNNSYHGNYDVWSWVPKIEFRVNGPIPSGSQLYVEFMQPGGSAPWVTFDCDTDETQKGRWWKTECGGRQVEDKSTTAVGPVNFAIKMRNELAGTNSTIFTGKMKVAKTLSNEVGPKAANKFVYYVDHDWNLPIGYIFYTPDDVYGWEYPSFNVAFWVRGEAVRFDPHLFYQGKEIGRVFNDGIQVGTASCEAKVENGTTHYVNDAMPQKAKWARVECSFPIVKQWDKTQGGQPNSNEMFMMASNPGEYEFKLLWNNKLARSLKFTVGPGGKLDNGIASSNKLGSDRVIVPVTIIGDQDGTWDRTAWKTDAFYGNPLSGFAPTQ
ncbi:MAG TPA: hypothetical protein VGX92_09365 [Pyrinomonadaceae bacterium]|nr:hypothetical protein [Pyrinomonadaceae bacterium]